MTAVMVNTKINFYTQKEVFQDCLIITGTPEQLHLICLLSFHQAMIPNHIYQLQKALTVLGII